MWIDNNSNIDSNKESQLSTNTRLEQLRQEIITMEEKSDLTTEEIELLESLRIEKQSIIEETRQELQTRVDDIEVPLINSWLTPEERNSIRQEINNNLLNIEDFTNDPLLAILFTILKSISNKWQSNSINLSQSNNYNTTNTSIDTPQVTNTDENDISNNYEIQHSREDFIREASRLAKDIEKQYWIPWQVSTAQCILESWWGESRLSRNYWNYFWVKSHWLSWWVTMSTNEEVWWRMIRERASFRTYWIMNNEKFPWLTRSFHWYAEFLTKNPRYRPAFAYWYDINPKPSHYPNDYRGLNNIQFAIEIARAWYATDSRYAQKVNSIASRVERMDNNFI